jgi:hypothetical protein
VTCLPVRPRLKLLIDEPNPSGAAEPFEVANFVGNEPRIEYGSGCGRISMLTSS